MISTFFRGTGSTAILIGCAILALTAAGCSTTAKVAQSAKGQVYLEEVTDWSFEASHPSVIDQSTMMKIMKGLYSDESQNGSSRMSAGGSKPMRIFSDEDAEFIVPLLTQGLAKAKPEQLVGFRISSSAGSGFEPTTGSIYVQKDSVYITISKGARVTGFMPESVARTESAPSYAASGSMDAMVTVIDYHALAKAPIASLPSVKTTAKSQPTAMSVSIPAAAPAKAQLASSTSNASIQGDFTAPSENNQIEKAKEALAKKDLEINMLRKEADWMKRELRDRDEEIKALKATKVSGKPAPKKKQAEAYRTR